MSHQPCWLSRGKKTLAPLADLRDLQGHCMLLEASVRGWKVQSEKWNADRIPQRGQVSSHPQEHAPGTDGTSHCSMLMGFSDVLIIKVKCMSQTQLVQSWQGHLPSRRSGVGVKEDQMSYRWLAYKAEVAGKEQR